MTPVGPDDPSYYDDDGQGYGEGFMTDMINEGGHETQTQTHEGEVEVEIMDVADEPLFSEELACQEAAQKRTVSQRTMAYSQAEDVMLCEAWIEVGQDPIKGAEKNRQIFWKSTTTSTNTGCFLQPGNLAGHLRVHGMSVHSRRDGVSYNRSVASSSAPTTMLLPGP